MCNQFNNFHNNHNSLYYRAAENYAEKSKSKSVAQLYGETGPKKIIIHKKGIRY